MSTDPATPGRGTSFQDRPAAGLYVAAWVLGGLGLGALIVGAVAQPPLRGILIMAAFLALLLGLGAACGYQILARRLRPEERFRGPAPLLLFGFQFVLVNAVTLVLLTLGVPLTDSTVGFFVATVVLLLGYIAVVWLFGVRSGATTWRDMGLLPHLGIRRLVGDIGVGAAVMLGVALAAGILGGLLARFLGVEAPEVVPVPNTAIEILLIALGAGVLVPIGEELFFRGYTLTAWWRDLGPRAALWRSTVFFALVHIATLSSTTFGEGVRQAILVLAVIGPVGYALGWLFIRRGLVASIAGHMAFNLFGVLVLVLAQNLPTPPS
ncbi:MAG: type II CAAX endopeptidase family protein [Chloroflexota bacterium]